MNVQDIIAQAGGIGAIAEQLGISEREASKGVDALLPSVMGGFKKSAVNFGGSEEGLGGLLSMAQAAGGAGLFDNVLGNEPTNVGAGNDILGQIFGSKDVSRTVANHAAGQSGLDPSILKKMLPIVAMLVTGYLARSGGGGSTGGGHGDMLGSVLGGGAQGGALGGLLGGLSEGGQQATSQGGGSLLGGL
ncbi:MAG: DUF937 domain-containing protein, partial [Rhodospirillum sp.]|nr:DUF937 domain-containing protein [Rhodospirillum sp.]